MNLNYILENVPIEIIDNKNIVTVQIPEELEGSSLNFKIRLIFLYHDGSNFTPIPYSELPENFNERYTIDKKIKISYPIVTYSLIPNEEDKECVGGTEMFNSFSVVDNFGNFIGPNYETTTVNKYKYVRNNTTLALDYAAPTITPETPGGLYYEYCLGFYDFIGTYPYVAINFVPVNNNSFN